MVKLIKKNNKLKRIRQMKQRFLRNIRDVLKRFAKYKTFFLICLLFLVVFVAFEQTLSMYFWHDDYPILYKLQKPQEIAGTYGTGILGLDSPYRYTAVPFVPFFSLFGLEPRGYYIIGIILYFVATVSVYLLAKILTESRRVALASALIFASGYIGSDSLNAVGVSWQNILATIFLTLTAVIYFKFAKSRRILFYFLALILYIFTMEFSHIRAHGIILFIISIELLFYFKPLLSLIRMLPFAIGYYFFYINPPGPHVQSSHLISYLFNKIFIEGNLSLLLTPIITLENIFIPDKIHFPLIIFLAVLTAILIWARSKKLLYALLFTVANFIAYFLYWPDGSQESTHRYLNTSFVGASIFLGICINHIFRKKNSYIYVLVAVIVVTNLILVRADQAKIVRERSKPAEIFWQIFHSRTPQIEAGSLIYVDAKQDAPSSIAFSSAIGVGAMGTSTSYAVHYGLRWQDIYHSETFQELLYLLKIKKTTKDKIHTFAYGIDDGLVSTTKNTREALFGPQKTISVNNLDKIDVPFSSPLLLSFDSDLSINFSGINYKDNKSINLSNYLSYLSSKSTYYDTAAITSNSESRYTEIRNIHDKNSDTSWKALTSFWREHRKEEITVDLGSIKHIGGIKIIPGSILRIPTKYRYECSLDRENWQELAFIRRKVEDSDPFADKFSETDCQFVKLTIFEVNTDEPPQISELEVLKNDYANLDFEIAKMVYNNPFQFITAVTDEELLLDYFSKNGIPVSICIYTDKYKLKDKYCKIHTFTLGSSARGEFIVDPGGTVLNRITLSAPPQISIAIHNPKLTTLTYDQLDKMGYIVDYAGW